MSRVEGNNQTINNIYDDIKETPYGTPEEASGSQRGYIVSLLADISRSLAVIADSLVLDVESEDRE